MTSSRSSRSLLISFVVVLAGILAVAWLFLGADDPPRTVDCLALLREAARGETVTDDPSCIRTLVFDGSDVEDPLKAPRGVTLETEGVTVQAGEGETLSMIVHSVDHLVRLRFDPPLEARAVTLLSFEARSTPSSDRPFLFFTGPGEAIDPSRSVRFDFAYDDRFHPVAVGLEDSRAWKGEIDSLALRFLYTAGSLLQKPARLELRNLALWQTRGPVSRARLISHLAGQESSEDGVDLLTSATLNNEGRPALFVATPSRYELPLTIPGHAFLDVEFGTLESSWNKSGDGVTFSVSVIDAEGEEKRLFSRYVNPKEKLEDCRWHDGRIPLDGYADQQARLVFETFPGPGVSPSGNEEYDYPVWSNIDLVRNPPDEPKPRSVVVVCLDTLRADRLGCYGYSRPTSPNLDALANRGVLFETAISQAPETLAAHMSLFTGLYPREHHVWDTETLSEELPYLLEAFRAEGYRTAAFTEDGGVSPVHGFDRGFQCYHEGALQSKRGSKRVEETFGKAAQWIRRYGDRPFFLFVHTYETHTPYDPPAADVEAFAGDYDGRIRPPVSWAKMESLLLKMHEEPLSGADFAFVSNLYDAGIHHVDGELASFFSVLDEVGIDGSTLRVVLSDHGEDFWDHFGFATHGHTLYEEMIHVPLILAGGPVAGFEGRRIPDQVELIDVLPTVLDLLDVPFPEDAISGKSLVPLLEGSSFSEEPAFAEDHTLFERLAVRTRVEGVPYKLIHSPGIEKDPYAEKIRAFVDLSRFDGILEEWELYRLDEDPGELRNLFGKRPEIGEALARMLTRFLDEHELGPAGGAAEISDEHRRQLEALGYVQADQAEELRKKEEKKDDEDPGGDPDPPGPEPDPPGGSD